MTVSPGAFERTAATSASGPSITRSSTLVTTAPLGNPAAAAGLPSTTSAIDAPRAVVSLLSCTPNEPWVAVPVDINSSAMRFA